MISVIYHGKNVQYPLALYGKNNGEYFQGCFMIFNPKLGIKDNIISNLQRQC